MLFKPSKATFEDMRRRLETFYTPTEMAEQDFLSWFYAVPGMWNALHKKFNWQAHQVWRCEGEKPPVGQNTASSFYRMLQHPEEIRIYHYSAPDKPSHMLMQRLVQR